MAHTRAYATQKIWASSKLSHSCSTAVAIGARAETRTIHWSCAMLLCAITDRTLLGADADAQHEGLLRQARIWAEAGLALIQIREKDLPASEQIALVRAMQSAIRAAKTPTKPKLVLNAPVAVALAVGADGVHLPAEGAAAALRALRSGNVAGAASLWVSVSCHTLAEVEPACAAGADCILFAPVFEKQIAGKEIAGKKISDRPRAISSGADFSQAASRLPGVGLKALAAACHAAGSIPVLALGGVTAENAAACVAAGASGIAAIRLFHEPPSAWSALR